MPAPCAAHRRLPPRRFPSGHRPPRLVLPSLSPLIRTHPCLLLSYSLVFFLFLFCFFRARPPHNADRRRVGRPRDGPPHPRVGGRHSAGAIGAAGRRGRVSAAGAARVAGPRGLCLRACLEGLGAACCVRGRDQPCLMDAAGAEQGGEEGAGQGSWGRRGGLGRWYLRADVRAGTAPGDGGGGWDVRGGGLSGFSEELCLSSAPRRNARRVPRVDRATCDGSTPAN